MIARFVSASCSRLSGLRRWGLALALGLVAAAPLACDEPITCFANECVEAFTWEARSSDGGALPPGTYAFEAELDGTRLGFSCTIAETMGASACDTPVVLEGDGDFDVALGLRTVTDGFQDPSDQVGRIELSASEHVEGGVTGPKDVHITATRDGQPVVDESYAVTYERDEDYHGDERCGFCDGSETRTVEITEQPA